MIRVISQPQYNALIVPEEVAWPETDEQAFELAHLLTGCYCDYVDTDEDAPACGYCGMGVGIDGADYEVSYEIKGIYYTQSAAGADMGHLYAVIGGVHLIRKESA